MQAWFVHGYQESNSLTPASILTLFIVSILACFWALVTLFRMSSVRRNAAFVALVDLLFVGGFIAADYELRGIGNANCANFERGSIFVDLGVFGYYGVNGGSRWAANISKTCAMLKASWAFGIINTILFFFSSLLALLLHRHERRETVVRETRVRRSHSGRHSSRRSHSGGSRRHSSSRRQYYV